MLTISRTGKHSETPGAATLRVLRGDHMTEHRLENIETFLAVVMDMVAHRLLDHELRKLLGDDIQIDRDL